MDTRHFRAWIAIPALIALTIGARPPRAAAADATIQAGDVLAVRVSGEPGLTQNYPVDDQGDIVMDMAGKIPVVGLSGAEAQDRITQGLRKYLKLFAVDVTIVGEAGGHALVFGEVMKPGPIRLGAGSRLLDVLAQAGQLTPTADVQHIRILRKGKESPDVYSLDQVVKDASLNVAIHGGDTITVPSQSAHAVMVEGEVQKPGPRTLDAFRTAYAAVASAQPTENADWTRIALRRNGSDIPMIVDLSPVRAGQLKDDLELQPGDQLTVMSRFKGLVTVRGEVKTPGEKPLNGHVQLWDFIVNSGGGFTETADRKNVEVLRDGLDPLRFNLDAVAQGQVNSADPKMEVHPGDVIFVPNDEQNRFTIVGGVNRPGSYPAKERMTLLDAIAAAGGFSPLATHKQFVVALADRADGRAQRFERAASPSTTAADATGPRLLTIDYRKLIKGDAIQNLPIRPGDHILIPEDTRAPRPSVWDQALRALPFVSIFSRGRGIY